jgi:hypothetical protein
MILQNKIFGKCGYFENLLFPKLELFLLVRALYGRVYGREGYSNSIGYADGISRGWLEWRWIAC